MPFEVFRSCNGENCVYEAKSRFHVHFGLNVHFQVFYMSQKLKLHFQVRLGKISNFKAIRLVKAKTEFLSKNDILL